MTEQALPVDRRLLDAVVGVADGLEIEPALRRIVRAASDLTGAPYAALGVLGPDGLHEAFVHTGIDPALAARIGQLPRGHGVLGHITRAGRAVRVEELAAHPASVGFPPGHPPMKSFLGVPVGIGERVVGNLYLADKADGFTSEDEDVVVALAAAAAVAVENARLYEDVRLRERWMTAAQEVSTAILSGAQEEDALLLVAQRAREVARARTAALVLPGYGGDWMLEIAEGDHADELVGTVMPQDGRTLEVMSSGRGLRVPEFAAEMDVRITVLKAFGPAMYAPLVAGVEKVGVLILLRMPQDREFTDTDLATAQAFAGQAALALQMAQARRHAETVELLEERARIARDLHDLVVQELFAMGMRLARLRERLEPGTLAEVDGSLDSLDRVVRQIRSTIRALRDPEESTGLVDRIHAEANRAHGLLGYHPQVTIEDGEELDAVVPGEVADDVIAVVREGLSNAARHARAAAVTVRVRLADGRVEVQVTDDGVGMPAGVARRSGLDNLGERARRHGGWCKVRPNSGAADLGNQTAAAGTSLLWQVPLAP